MTSLTLAQNAPPLVPYTRLLTITGILLAFGLRLYRLGAESLWYDETVSVFLAQQSVPDLIAHTARDIHPPGYYLLLHLWGWLAQPTLATGLEFLYAWPSLFCGLLLLPLVYALGRKFFSGRVALVALWLAAVNPYHIWYSQEVRMYTLGALLGLLCLWAVSGRRQAADDASSIRHSPFTIHHSLFLYIFTAAAGLYTLYYFAFLLIALNILVLWQHRPNSRSLRPWLFANLAALLLWSPWLPTFWRQMTEPPVPPWRGALDGFVVLQESLAGLLVGQSPPLGMLWPWAAVMAGLFLIVFLGYNRKTAEEKKAEEARGLWTLLVFVFLPLLLIVLFSVTATPLYHIRYFFTYAAIAVLLMAGALDYTLGRHRWLHAITLIGVFGISGWSLSEFWTDPLYRSDDHRAAVTQMAEEWRPGDAVLVNAGWVYTALAVYWPHAPFATGATPAQQPERIRLIDYAQNNDTSSTAENEQPIFLLGGSIDGPASLGWGLPESDFYPLTRQEAQNALARVAEQNRRIWHYRLYDTVSDPNGVVRAWLDEQTAPLLDLPYPGRDYLRVQLFETAANNDPNRCPPEAAQPIVFGDGVVLRGAAYSPAPHPGSALYASLCWGIDERISRENLRTSLRLYGLANGEAALAVQKDEAPFLPQIVATRNMYRTELALPLPVDLPAGSYRLELIVYDGMTGEPLPIDNPQAIVGQRWPLAESLEIGEQEK